MGAGAFHGRVRDGIGCRHPAIATRSSNTPGFASRRNEGVRFWFAAIRGAAKIAMCAASAAWRTARMTAVQDG